MLWKMYMVYASEKCYFGTLLFERFFHPTFRVGGPMEYLRGPRVKRSKEMGRKAITKSNRF